MFASTADVYAASASPHTEDDPVAPCGVYGCSTLLGEWLLRDQAHRLGGCGIIIARLFNVYGPGDPHRHLLPEVLRETRRCAVLRLGDVDAVRDFVYVEDAADTLVVLLRTAQSGVFNIGTGTPVVGRELVDIVADLTGRRLDIHLDRDRLRRQHRPVSCAVPDRLRTFLPWWPRTSLREGIQLTITADLGDITDECEGTAAPSLVFLLDTPNVWRGRALAGTPARVLALAEHGHRAGADVTLVLCDRGADYGTAADWPFDVLLVYPSDFYPVRRPAPRCPIAVHERLRATQQLDAAAHHLTPRVWTNAKPRDGITESVNRYLM